ncbi:hypothetical protein ACG907_02730 [Acinetobacter bereziniae]|uniref:hypothetical protein n=1 Tax=Acinetobacter bereziniae TaxID=106648 RepID=UPI0021E490BE|nr:hypothetical protein [Acinetobacter bereziniae]MCV2444768.1 hypothetical protein [Acinetobacter bereziniae]
MDKFEDAFKKISKVNLATHIELWGEPKTEKLYFEAGQQSRQAEINQLQSQINEMAEVGLSQENVIKEKDKGIESALSELESLHNKKWAEWKEQADMHSQGEANAYEHAMQILEKTLRGEHANS